MKANCQNIYKAARNSASLVQSKASILLNVSGRSLTDYETDKTIPPDDIVVAMIEVYKAPWLALRHLKKSTLVGQKCLPDFTITDLPRAVLKLKKEINDIIEMDNLIVELACDGQIDSDEQLIWKEKILKEVYEVFAASGQFMQSI